MLLRETKGESDVNFSLSTLSFFTFILFFVGEFGLQNA